MKSVSLILIALLSLNFSMQTKKKIIFFGDSITELGVKPGGYILRLDSIFNQNGPSNNYQLIGSGISANKVYDLYLRLENDVLSQNPDAVVIWIGVNDVWHKKLLGTGTDADKFESFYNALIKKLKEKKIEVFLCTPAVIGEKWDCTNELDGDLNKYAEAIRQIAKKNNCTLIDFRKEFLDHLKLNNKDNAAKGILTYDGVHLSAAGNKLVTERMYAALTSHYSKKDK